MLKYPQKLRCTTRTYRTHRFWSIGRPAGAHRNLHPLKILNHHKFKDQTLFGKQDWQIYSTALIKLHFNNRPGLGKADGAAKGPARRAKSARFRVVVGLGSLAPSESRFLVCLFGQAILALSRSVPNCLLRTAAANQLVVCVRAGNGR